MSNLKEHLKLLERKRFVILFCFNRTVFFFAESEQIAAVFLWLNHLEEMIKWMILIDVAKIGTTFV